MEDGGRPRREAGRTTAGRSGRRPPMSRSLRAGPCAALGSGCLKELGLEACKDRGDLFFPFLQDPAHCTIVGPRDLHEKTREVRLQHFPKELPFGFRQMEFHEVTPFSRAGRRAGRERQARWNATRTIPLYRLIAPLSSPGKDSHQKGKFSPSGRAEPVEGVPLRIA